MSDSLSTPMQFALILLNSAGVLITGLALVDMLTPIKVSPEGYALPYYQWTMLVVGIAMCVLSGLIRLGALINETVHHH
ncbi:hypothetical protein ACKC9G_05945 [Pokkaliibacter sp. CJK22405]|uniref:hypothetical protein n=1 Tax=Pokkaliibacter sp. CJK22405 TaxID=3384615 RepID=UPI003984BF89